MLFKWDRISRCSFGTRLPFRAVSCHLLTHVGSGRTISTTMLIVVSVVLSRLRTAVAQEHVYCHHYCQERLKTSGFAPPQLEYLAYVPCRSARNKSGQASFDCGDPAQSIAPEPKVLLGRQARALEFKGFGPQLSGKATSLLLSKATSDS